MLNPNKWAVFIFEGKWLELRIWPTLFKVVSMVKSAQRVGQINMQNMQCFSWDRSQNKRYFSNVLASMLAFNKPSFKE